MMKAVMKATSTILEAMPEPSHRMTTGAKATAGTLFAATMGSMATRRRAGR
jgi:hypothetical protein